jgi:hypothetical protein
MSLPEISRRCLACGASVRPGARFCPQCGYNLAAVDGAEGGEAARAAETAEGERASSETLRPEPGATRGGGQPGADGRPWFEFEAPPHGAVTSPPTRPAPPTRPGTESAAREEPRPARTTRDVETPADGATPTTREALATARDVTPPPAPPARETASHTFDGGVREATGAVGEGARTTAETAAGGAAPTAAGFEGGAAAGRSRRAAARVKETVMPRVERMRDEALVRMEETPDDSGLRFVVIAVVLFGLFLLFLFLSTTVLR